MTSDFIENAKAAFEGHRVTREAFLVAQRAHGGQERKYTFEPYFEHPIRVALRLADLGEHPHAVAAALLHDVIEDTPITADELLRRFPDEVVELVLAVTNPECPGCKNRKARKAKCREHLAQAPAAAQTLKYADVLENIESIAHHDPKFAATYLIEKQQLLEVMPDGHPELRERAILRVEDLLFWIPTANKAVQDAEHLSK